MPEAEGLLDYTEGRQKSQVLQKVTIAEQTVESQGRMDIDHIGESHVHKTHRGQRRPSKPHTLSLVPDHY